MKTAHIVTVRLLIEADRRESACCTLSELTGLLTENMQKYAGPESALIDWEYVNGVDDSKVAVPDDYDESGIDTLTAKE